MSKRWYQESRRDPWRRQARSKGYRARSAYKLKHIQERFSIIRKGDVVLDVGCHPGGWTQVASEEVGEEGVVIGVDLLATAPVEGATVIIGDITEEATIQQIREALDGREINTVISDISPRLTGRYDTDQAISLELSTTVLDVAMYVLNPGGTFITKAFQGTGIEGLVEAARDRFSNVQRFAPTASRNSSSETYLICRNKLPRVRKRGAGLTAMEQVSKHLAGLGILTGKQEVEEEERAVGLRRISKKEEE
ncbi:MAG: RlmE family RNA methyltransferase [Candidatus Thermoplasmatota archaeon]|nr:RlmE family RNA methyltransferase [Candidatus Thermoplasmatota archaeon]MED5274031.1 RlmE family RNA methyltransferase [Candidatus Thermoplasmatota archaeon]